MSDFIANPKGMRIIVTLSHPTTPNIRVVVITYPYQGHRWYAAGIVSPVNNDVYAYSNLPHLPETYRWGMLMLEVLHRGTGLSHKEVSLRCRYAAYPDTSLSRVGLEKVRWVEAVIGATTCTAIRRLPLPNMPREVQALAQRDIKAELKQQKRRPMR